MTNIIQSVYDSILNLYPNTAVLSKYTSEEIKEEIKDILSSYSSSPLPYSDVLAQRVVESLNYKHLFNELSSDYDLLDKDSFLSFLTTRLLQSDNLLSIYDEDFTQLKAEYKGKNQLLKQENLQLQLQNQQLSNQFPVPLSEEDLFHITYPDLNKILLSEEYLSRYANSLCNIHNIKLNAALFTIEHYPLFSYTKCPIDSPSVVEHKLYPYGLPDMREADPETFLPLNFDPASEVYIIGVSLRSFKLKPNKLSCARLNVENNSSYPSFDWIEESLPRCNDTQFYFSQPIWEAFKARYEYQINFIIHFAVFKAKPVLPSLFKQYWDKQSNSDMCDSCNYFRYFQISKLSNSATNLDIRYPVMKLFYSSYLMSYYLNLTENVIKTIPLNTPTTPTSTSNFTTPITSVAALKAGDLVYVNRFNFGIVIGEKEIFLDNNLIITEADYNKFYLSDSKDCFIIPELLLFSESILDDELLSIKDNINKQYKVYVYSKLNKPAIL